MIFFFNPGQTSPPTVNSQIQLCTYHLHLTSNMYQNPKPTTVFPTPLNSTLIYQLFASKTLFSFIYPSCDPSANPSDKFFRMKTPILSRTNKAPEEMLPCSSPPYPAELSSHHFPSFTSSAILVSLWFLHHSKHTFPFLVFTLASV